jgi:hypothetical protein
VINASSGSRMARLRQAIVPRYLKENLKTACPVSLSLKSILRQAPRRLFKGLLTLQTFAQLLIASDFFGLPAGAGLSLGAVAVFCDSCHINPEQGLCGYS